jgi:preprotein translocase subunit Sec61beta
MANLQIPSSGSGLTRYNEEYSSVFKIKPATVIGMTVVTIILEIILHFIIK